MTIVLLTKAAKIYQKDLGPASASVASDDLKYGWDVGKNTRGSIAD